MTTDDRHRSHRSASPSSNRNSKKITLELPYGFRNMLQNFTIDVLKKKPKNPVNFAVKYFQDLQQSGQHDFHPTSGMKRITTNAKVKFSPSRPPIRDQSTVYDEDFLLPEDRIAFHKTNRRKSIACERYDPNEHVGEVVKVCHPKSDTQRARLRKVCKDILLFRNLEPEELNDVVDAMFEKRVNSNVNIIVQGEEGDNFYVIDNGNFDVYVTDEQGNNMKVNEYHGSGSFGELSLMYQAPRAATITSRSPGALWCLDRQTFRQMVLMKAYKKRMAYEKLLNSIPLLSELNSYERMSLADALQTKIFHNGQVIFKQGESGTDLYFVEQGSVDIVYTDPRTHAKTHLTSLKTGDYFGELALVTANPRAASAVSTGLTKLASLDVRSFERLMGPCKDIMKRNITTYKKQLDAAVQRDRGYT